VCEAAKVLSSTAEPEIRRRKYMCFIPLLSEFRIHALGKELQGQAFIVNGWPCEARHFLDPVI
jgi:hypothetical protein